MTDDAPLFGEEWLTALLLAMVVEHCTGHSPPRMQRTLRRVYRDENGNEP